MPRPTCRFVDASTQTPSPLRLYTSDDTSDNETSYNDLVSPTPQQVRVPSPGRPRLRPVSRSDEELLALAQATKRKINWDVILHASHANEATNWKWLEHNGDFSIFVREHGNKYEVLAIGVVSANVAELVKVIHASNNSQYLRKMEAIYGDHFRDGCFVYNANIESDLLQEMSSDGVDADDNSTLVGLSVKTATFNKPNWRSSNEEWCYVDAVYQQPHPDGPVAGEDTFEKVMTSLRPQEIIAGLSPGRTKYIENVVSGYLLKPEPTVEADAGKTTRVHFYCELTMTPNHQLFGGLVLPTFGSTATDKTTKNRLFMMARSCARLPLIIRRRRLGMQAVVDSTKLLPLANARCVQCLGFLLMAKRCRLCGEGVCQGCSAKHYRETRGHVHHIRVCHGCMDRVDRSSYSCLKLASRTSPRVESNNTPEDDTRSSDVLRTLLQDAYQNAGSLERRASVLSVIKCVIDQERRSSVAPAAAMGNVSDPLQPTVSELCSRAETRSSDAISPQCLNEPRIHPVPKDEARRLEAIEEEHLRELGNIPELNVICEIAAKELGCFATMVTVIDKDVQLILGANREELREALFPREDTFCSHIIMNDEPLIVPHPETDIRFYQCGPVQQQGARYYCGFPLLARNGTVLGSLCCVDTKTHELTECQYATLQELAHTATKVVRQATKQFEEHQLTQEMLQYACCRRFREGPVAAAS